MRTPNLQLLAALLVMLFNFTLQASESSSDETRRTIIILTEDQIKGHARSDHSIAVPVVPNTQTHQKKQEDLEKLITALGWTPPPPNGSHIDNKAPGAHNPTSVTGASSHTVTLPHSVFLSHSLTTPHPPTEHFLLSPQHPSTTPQPPPPTPHPPSTPPPPPPPPTPPPPPPPPQPPPTPPPPPPPPHPPPSPPSPETSECDKNIVSRSSWKARNRKSAADQLRHPLEHVIIGHTVTPACDNKEACSETMRTMQNYHMDTNDWADIGYNFVIGNDGEVYEGVGWNTEGAHTKGWNSKALGIAFVGNFMEIHPSEKMLNAAKDLIECGVKKGYISGARQVHGARDATCTLSPGDHLYDAIRSWHGFVGGKLPGHTC